MSAEHHGGHGGEDPGSFADIIVSLILAFTLIPEVTQLGEDVVQNGVIGSFHH